MMKRLLKSIRKAPKENTARRTRSGLDFKDLEISGNGVLSTTVDAILRNDSAQRQIKALKNVKIKGKT